MIALTLYRKHNGKDVRLGTGWFETLPPAGTLLTFHCEEGTVWRVIHPYVHLIMEGSMAHRGILTGRRTDPAHADLFVEPAQGPFEP